MPAAGALTYASRAVGRAAPRRPCPPPPSAVRPRSSTSRPTCARAQPPAPRRTAPAGPLSAIPTSAPPDRASAPPPPGGAGGAVVLAVVADREGRWWQVMECCSRCAAAHPTAKVVATAPPPARTAPRQAGPDGSAEDRQAAAPGPRGGRPAPAADPFQVTEGAAPGALLRPPLLAQRPRTGRRRVRRTVPTSGTGRPVAAVRAPRQTAEGEDRPALRPARPPSGLPPGRTHRARRTLPRLPAARRTRPRAPRRASRP